MQLFLFLLSCFVAQAKANYAIVCKTFVLVNTDNSNSELSCTSSVLFYEENEETKENQTQTINKMKEHLQELQNRSRELKELEKKFGDLKLLFEAFKACSSNPCLNGNCSYSNNTYLCSCNPGYTGTNCQTDVDECQSNPCIHGTCLDQTNGYSCDCEAGYKDENCSTNCKLKLGMENKTIPDSRITASSQYSPQHMPYEARLNNQKSPTTIGAWVPATFGQGLTFKPPGQIWIQVKLVLHQYVTGVITQGRPGGFDNFISSFNITYSDDGTHFKTISKEFVGNTNGHTPVTNYFPQPILTSYIRLYPITWNRAPTLRMELLGCNQ